jgi:hypothetical protein
MVIEVTPPIQQTCCVGLRMAAWFGDLMTLLLAAGQLIRVM